MTLVGIVVALAIVVAVVLLWNGLLLGGGWILTKILDKPAEWLAKHTKY